MQRGFTKLFNTIVTSTIWQEDDKTRIVWITMLAISDPYGIVSASIPGLASVANVSVDETRVSVKNLLSPDPDSRTKDYEGRRIEEIDGGWRILNYVKYRKMLSEAERADYKAKWIREKRRQMSTVSTVDDTNGQKSTVPSASSSISASSEEEGSGEKPTVDDIYQAYPRHESKPEAFRAINKAIKNGTDRSFLLERTVAYAKTQPPRSKFTPLPATWFNAERFNDDPSEWQREDSQTSKPKKPWDTIPKPKPNFGELYGT